MKNIIVTGINPECPYGGSVKFQLGYHFVLMSDMIDYDNEYSHVRLGNNFIFYPIKKDDDTILLAYYGSIVSDDPQYFVGSLDHIDSFAEYLHSNRFAKDEQLFDENTEKLVNVTDIISERDLVILGYHIQRSYGENIRCYLNDNTSMMFVVVKDVLPGLTKIACFKDKNDSDPFADFMNRYSYVNS